MTDTATRSGESTDSTTPPVNPDTAQHLFEQLHFSQGRDGITTKMLATLAGDPQPAVRALVTQVCERLVQDFEARRTGDNDLTLWNAKAAESLVNDLGRVLPAGRLTEALDTLAPLEALPRFRGHALLLCQGVSNQNTDLITWWIGHMTARYSHADLLTGMLRLGTDVKSFPKRRGGQAEGFSMAAAGLAYMAFNCHNVITQIATQDSDQRAMWLARHILKTLAGRLLTVSGRRRYAYLGTEAQETAIQAIQYDRVISEKVLPEPVLQWATAWQHQRLKAATAEARKGKKEKTPARRL